MVARLFPGTRVAYLCSEGCAIGGFLCSTAPWLSLRLPLARALPFPMCQEAHRRYRGYPRYGGYPSFHLGYAPGYYPSFSIGNPSAPGRRVHRFARSGNTFERTIELDNGRNSSVESLRSFPDRDGFVPDRRGSDAAESQARRPGRHRGTNRRAASIVASASPRC